MHQQDQAAAVAPDYDTVLAIPAPGSPNGVWVEGMTVIAVADGMSYRYRLRAAEALSLAAALTANVAAIARALENQKASLAAADHAGTA